MDLFIKDIFENWEQENNNIATLQKQICCFKDVSIFILHVHIYIEQINNKWFYCSIMLVLLPLNIILTESLRIKRFFQWFSLWIAC